MTPGRHVRGGLALLAAAAALAAPAVALPAQGAPGLALTPAGDASLVVTFADELPGSAVHAALDHLGAVRPLVPEAGVWVVRAPATAGLRDQALGVRGVTGAEWSLVRRPDDIAPAAPAPPQPLVPVATPTDPYFTPRHQPGLFPPASSWSPELTGIGPRPRIAILDGGIDSSHEEWSGPGSPLVRPYSAWTNVESADDWGRTGHGTHVAGTAAAPANGLGVVGVAPGAAGTAEVIPVQIADRNGYSTDATMMDGIRWAVRNGAKVINISAGGAGASRSFQNVIDWAFRNGALVVASVGNDGQDYGVPNYPAGYAHVLGVAAQCTGTPDPDCPTPFGLATFSDRNASVDVVAPGVDILSSVPRGITAGAIAPGYAVKSGTSMAAPYVAGLAALVFAANPGATPYQVMRHIMNTANGAGPPGWDPSYGNGFVNVRAAVTLPLPPDDPTEVNDDVHDVTTETAISLTSAPTTVTAAIDFANDPHDLYPVMLRKGQNVRLRVRGTSGARMRLALWAPRRRSITAAGARPAAALKTASTSPRLGYVATSTGRWYVDVQAVSGRGSYTLKVTR